MIIGHEGEVIKKGINRVIENAGITLNDIDYINAHGTATELNDKTEAKVIEDLFGHQVLVNSTKSLVGRTISASGAIEAIVTTLSMYNKKTHVNHNLEIPISDLNFARNNNQECDFKYAMSESFGFGRHNAILLFKNTNE